MASRNLNFPQSYGTNVVMVPFFVFGQATGGGTGLNILPNLTFPQDDYSFTTVVTPSTGPGVPNRLSVYLVDRYRELVFAKMHYGQADPGVYPRFVGTETTPDGRFGVSIDYYRFLAGVFTPEYVNGPISGLFIVRGGTAKF